MKKLFFFLSVSALILTSCSSDDDNNSPVAPVLLQKTIETAANGSIITSIATYNGTKISKITAEGFVINFTYTGDLITKAESFFAGQLVQKETYSYNSTGNLVEYVNVESFFGDGIRETYVHNANGTISVTHYSGDELTQNDLEGTGTITFTNGEVSTMVSTFGDNISYTYDDKNNPFKNVTGYSKISFVDGTANGIMHNVLTESWNGGNLVNTYTYTASGYPLTAQTVEMGQTSTTQFFYE